MLTIADQTRALTRRALYRLGGNGSLWGRTSTSADLTSAGWGSLGELQLTGAVRGVRPGTPLIGESRDRERSGLYSFALHRGTTSASGTVIHGVVPVDLLEALPKGRYDVRVSLVAGQRRKVLRLHAGHDISLPPPRHGVLAYVTDAGNVTLRRNHSFSVESSLPPFGADARAVPSDLALLVSEVRSVLARTRALGACDLSYSFCRPDTASLDSLFPGVRASLLIERSTSVWRIWVVGRDRTTERFLRNVLVNQARMQRIDTAQCHLLEEIDRGKDVFAVGGHLVRVLVGLLERFRLFLDAGDRPEDHGLVPASWWDVKPNFGDVLGPMLIESLAGRPAINVRAFPSQDPGLFAVGSLIGHLDRAGSRVWGSGLIGPPSTDKVAALAERRPRSIHAVRGARTREILRKDFGWEAPAVYGDPALLLPRYYEPRPAPATAGKVAIIPHYTHARLLSRDLPEDVTVIDVRHGPEAVIDQIVASRACVSSSLHGLVVAQAWEVPWVWLRAGGDKLRGNQFKFEDFYTVLDVDQVQAVDVPETHLMAHNWVKAVRRARVPRSSFDADALVSAFPPT